jgi:hypothetical protein
MKNTTDSDFQQARFVVRSFISIAIHPRLARLAISPPARQFFSSASSRSRPHVVPAPLRLRHRLQDHPPSPEPPAGRAALVSTMFRPSRPHLAVKAHPFSQFALGRDQREICMNRCTARRQMPDDLFSSARFDREEKKLVRCLFQLINFSYLSILFH